jgi:hypothetical protein
VDETSVTVIIEPTGSDGFTAWIKSQKDVRDIWWKSYGTKERAFRHAELLGLTSIEIITHDKVTATARRSPEEGATIDPEVLINHGFIKIQA